MDDAPASDELVLNFPCYAIRSAAGNGVVVENTIEGAGVLVILTNEDVLLWYRSARGLADRAVATFGSPVELLEALSRVSPSVTHVTFDPTPQAQVRCHRIENIRDALVSLIRGG